MAREKGSGSFREIERAGKKLYEYRIEGKSFYAKTKRECRDKYQEWKSNTHESRIERIVYFKDWATEWLEVYKHGKVEDGTYQNYKLYVEKHIVPFFEGQKIKDIRPAQINQFMSTKNELSESARHHIYVALNSIFKAAIRNRLCDENPCDEYVVPKDEKDKAAKIKYFDRDSLNRLLKGAQETDMGYFILIPLYTGLRIGEMCGLQWEDISEDIITVRHNVHKENGKEVLTTTKSGKERFVGITENLLEALKKAPQNGLYVFSGTNQFFTLHQMEKRYRKAFDKINEYLVENKLEPVKYLSAHKCRHTYATYLAEGGASAKDVQKILGHSSITTTQIYFHSNIEAIKNASNKLSY